LRRHDSFGPTRRALVSISARIFGPGARFTSFESRSVTWCRREHHDVEHDRPEFVRDTSRRDDGEQAQRDVDNLVAALRTGNANPGLGTRPLGNGFFELREANAGRVTIKETRLNTFDIVGKFQGHVRGNAANSAIIRRLMSDYLAF
jgi:hypothetical protein